MTRAQVWLTAAIAVFGAACGGTSGGRVVPSEAEQPASDPYAWLEAIDGERAIAWVRSMNEATRTALAADPAYEERYRQALAILDTQGRIPRVTQRGQWLYELRKSDAHPRGLFRRTTLGALRTPDPAWETVLDIDALSAREGERWVFHGMTCLPPAHRRCLVSLSPGGGDAVVVRELDAQTSQFVDGGFALPAAKTSIDWVDEDHVYVGTDFGPGSLTESGYSRVVKLWARGTPLAEAVTIYEGEPTSVSVSAWRHHGHGDEPAVDLVRESTTFWTGRYYQRIGDDLAPLAVPDDARVAGVYQQGLLISLQRAWEVGGETFPEGALVWAALAHLRAGDGPVELVFAPEARVRVEGAAVTAGRVVVKVLDNVAGRLWVMHRAGAGDWQRRPVALPEGGSLAILSASGGSEDVFVSYEGFTTPETLYWFRADDAQRAPEVLARQPATFDGARFEVTQHTATSADGTEVPYFVVARENLPLDGTHPTHIFSYGGFRNSLTPSYSGTYEDLHGVYGKLWLEPGGVFVLANIRGGGELGPAWHRAALRENRPRAFEDFEAVAEDLIRRKITSAPHIGIEGRSNGGLLVGATMLRRPELYGAIVCGVPLLDMRRYHELLAGASWVAEYGDPDDPADWAFLRTYSPYHNVSADADLPPALFYTSTRDDRVHPAHARKMAHKMKDQGHRVHYYENLEGGHAGSSTNEQLARRLALVYTFLWNVLE